MLKFRTMYADAAGHQAELEASNEADGPLFKIREDPRVTPVGARPAAALARRDPAALERPARRDEPRRPAAAAAARLRAARGLAPQALPRAPGRHRPVADLGPLEPRLRRPRPARLLLPRELVDLARHLDPGQDHPGGAQRSRRLLSWSASSSPARTGSSAAIFAATLGDAFMLVRRGRARAGRAAWVPCGRSARGRSCTSRRESSVGELVGAIVAERLARERRRHGRTCSRRVRAEAPGARVLVRLDRRRLRPRRADPDAGGRAASSRFRPTPRRRRPRSSRAASAEARRRGRAGLHPRGAGPGRALRRRLLDARRSPASSRRAAESCASATSTAERDHHRRSRRLSRVPAPARSAASRPAPTTSPPAAPCR